MMNISNPKNHKGPVRIEREADDAKRTWTARNIYAVDNVNVAQGPRVGVHGAEGKRASFQEQKELRAPLAEIINKAYADRAHEYAEHEYTNGGSIHDNTYERTQVHGVKLGRSNKPRRK